jgi:hypothetical protein
MANRHKYSAVVTSVDDPEKRMRIKVKCPELAEEGEELPYWFEARPIVSGTFGVCFIPSPGDQVEIELDLGEDNMGIIAPNPVWCSGLVDSIPDKFTDGYPKVCGFWTQKGNLIVLNDNDGSEGLLFQAHNGRVFVQLDSETETLRLTAPRIIIDGASIFIGDPDKEGQYVRRIHRFGKKVI